MIGLDTNMYKLYEFASSGNCYKLRLAMAILGVAYERIQKDITRGETRTQEFLSINPNGKIPVLQTPDGDYIPESNAALWYLASGTELCPSSRIEQARVLQWMFFEQYSHEPNIATSRYWISILGAEKTYLAELAEKRAKGYAALEVMEKHLNSRSFFVGNSLTIADIALYAYTHVAHEGGFDLQEYRAVRRWLVQVEQAPGYVPITDTTLVEPADAG